MRSVLFISRKFPPVIGGMENYAFNMHKQFNTRYQTHDIILTKSQIHLIWFYPWIFIYGSYLLLFKKIDMVYVGDGVLCSVAWYFQRVCNKKTVLTIHGLDVIYNRFGYQKMVKLFLPKIKCIVANSSATKNAALLRGVSVDYCHVIPVGIDSQNCKPIDKTTAREHVSEQLGVNINNKKILFTLGRLIKRKGVFWFIDKVFERLPEDHIYFVAGDGKDFSRIYDLIKKKQLKDQVFLLGKVSENFKQKLFSVADVFMSPNISIENDMEGFGIVNLEAGLYGVPVVGCEVDGVEDAVVSGVTGQLTPEGEIEALKDAIKQVHQLKKNDIKAYVNSHFSWEAIFTRYEKHFN